MPTSPDLAQGLAKDVLRVYSDAEETLLALIAARLASGIDRPGWREAKLAEVQALRVAAQAVVDRLSRDGVAAADAAVRAAYNRGVATAGADLAASGLAASAAFGVIDEHKVAALVRAARDALGGLHLRITRAVTDVYQQVTTRASGQVLTGVLTRRQAAQQTLDQYAGAGIAGFTDTAGRRWNMASYAEMATRTMAGQAAVQGHVDRLQQMGGQLVIVSDAPAECVLCRPWEGKVLALTAASLGSHSGPNLRSGNGTVTVHVAATLAYAVARGLQHANCRHSVSLYQVGVTKPIVATADPQGDKNRQRQRYLERRIREAKRQQAVALDPAARKAAGVKVRARQGALREHIAAHGLKRLPYREQITRAI